MDMKHNLSDLIEKHGLTRAQLPDGENQLSKDDMYKVSDKVVITDGPYKHLPGVIKHVLPDMYIIKILDFSKEIAFEVERVRPQGKNDYEKNGKWTIQTLE